MIRIFIALFLIISSSGVFAQEGVQIELAKASINPSDMISVMRGAKFFATNCMTCHTMVYMRYNKLAQKAGVTYEKMPLHITTWPFGVTPPDLSLESDVRGDDWIYTYLHSFYQDSSRPTGVNNLLVPGTAMPNIVAPYQGTQILEQVPPAETLFGIYQWYDFLALQHGGTMTPDQFDRAITDLVNFLHYAANPYEQEQHAIGWWVLGFVFVLLIMLYFLKKEYWKDVKKLKDQN